MVTDALPIQIAQSAPPVMRLGWVNRTFRCIAREFEFGEEAGRVVITARREDSGVYADLLTADYQTGTSATDVFENDAPDAPTGLTATATVNGIRFTFTLGYTSPGDVVELWEHTSATPFSSATKVAEVGATFSNGWMEIHRRDDVTRYYWIRVRSPRGTVTDTYPATTGLAASAEYVQTTDIEIGAATDTYAVTNAGPITIELDAPSTQTLAQQVLYATVTLTDTFDIEVSASFRLGVSGDPSFEVLAFAAIWIGTTLDQSSQTISKASNEYEVFSITGLMSRPAGTYRVGVACTIFGDGSHNYDAIFRDLALRVTVIKR